MQRFQAIAVALLASLGLAFASAPALAQKQDAPKKTEAAKDTKKADAKAAAEPAKKMSEPMDINSASEKELATLKGIGDVRAAAIVKGRPYKGKDDLVKKKIVPKKVYDEIKDEIIAKQDTAAAAKKDEAKPAKKK